jgi:hypothetical protein
MPLSVLSIPLTTEQYMLIETTTNRVLDTGTKKYVYAMKNLIEETEQAQSNEKWMAEIFANRLQLMTQLTKSEKGAINVLIVTLPDYHQAWLKFKDAL